jgi:hypothetical protein
LLKQHDNDGNDNEALDFDPVLGLDQYTSPGIQYYLVSKIKQYGWLTHT